jgi:hypothetical protein
MRSIRLLFAALTLAALVVLAAPAFQASWMPGDLVRLHHFWAKGYWKLAKETVLLFPNTGQPFAGMAELSVYHLFGLNPAAFHAAALALFAAGLFLLYRLALLLGCSDLHAGFAVFPLAVHGGISRTYYRIAGLDHALALVFFLGALDYYVRTRIAGRSLTTRETVILAALYIAAIGASPLAISLPLVLLLYEWILGRGSARPAAWLALPALIFLAGQAVHNLAALRPALLWKLWINGNLSTTAELAFFPPSEFSRRAMYAAWAVLLYIAFRRRRPELRFAFGFFLLAMLPYTASAGRFLENTLIPACGFALILAAVPAGLAEFIAREPLPSRLPPALARTAAAIIVTLPLAAGVNLLSQDLRLNPLLGDPTIRSALGELHRLNPRIPPRATVFIRNDPTEGHSLVRLAPLWFHDRHARFFFPELGPEPPGAIVLEFQGNTLVMHRPEERR